MEAATAAGAGGVIGRSRHRSGGGSGGHGGRGGGGDSGRSDPLRPDEFGGGRIGKILALLVQRCGQPRDSLIDFAAKLGKIPVLLREDFEQYGAKLVESPRLVAISVKNKPVISLIEDTRAALIQFAPARQSIEVMKEFDAYTDESREAASEALFRVYSRDKCQQAREEWDKMFKQLEPSQLNYDMFLRGVVCAERMLITEQMPQIYADALQRAKMGSANGAKIVGLLPNIDSQNHFAPLRYVEAIWFQSIESRRRQLEKQIESIATSISVQRPNPATPP